MIAHIGGNNSTMINGIYSLHAEVAALLRRRSGEALLCPKELRVSLGAFAFLGQLCCPTGAGWLIWVSSISCGLCGYFAGRVLQRYRRDGRTELAITHATGTALAILWSHGGPLWKSRSSYIHVHMRFAFMVLDEPDSISRRESLAMSF